MAPVSISAEPVALLGRAMHESDSRVDLIQGIGVGLCLLAFLVWATRIIVRYKKGTMGPLEDGLITLAMLFSILESTVSYLAAVNGYGEHKNTLSYDQLSRALLWFWWAQITYKLTIWPTKLSLLCLYLRVLGSSASVTSYRLNFRKTVYGLMAFSATFCVITVIVNIFTCIPIHRYWHTKIHGYCGVSQYGWWMSQSILNTVSDIMILALPAPLVLNLKMPVRQKVGLAVVFGLGFFIVIVTIIRINTFKSGGLGDDTTYDGAMTLCWTLVETNVSIICACLPLIRPFLARIIPGLCGGTSMQSDSLQLGPCALKNTGGKKQCRNSHVPEKMRPRSWAGVETIISRLDGASSDQEYVHDVDIGEENAIRAHTNIEQTSGEAQSICGTDSLRRLTLPGVSGEPEGLPKGLPY